MKRHAKYKRLDVTRAMDRVFENLWYQYPEGLDHFASPAEGAAATELAKRGYLVHADGKFFLTDKGVQRLEAAGNTVHEDMGTVMQEGLMEASTKRIAASLKLATSVTHKGRKFVLAAERAPSPKRAKLRVNNCKGDGVTFALTIVAELAKDAKVDSLLPKGYSFKGPDAKKAGVSVSKVSSYGKLPQGVREKLDSGGDGDLAKRRLEKALGEPDEKGKKPKKKDLPNVYLVTADGGWNWSSKKGYEGLGLLTQILHVALSTNNKVVFSHCVNNLEGEGQTLL